MSESEPSQAELILQAMVASMPDIFFAKDAQGKYVLMNKAAASWLNLTIEQVIGQTDEALFPAETAQRIRAEDSRVLQGESPYRFEEEIVQGQQVRSLSTTKIVWRDSSGQPQGIIGISRDITEQKRTAQALQQSEEINQAILLALPDLIIRMDAEGTYLDVKAGNFPLSRLSEAKIGENVRDVLPLAAAEKRLEMVAKALSTRTMQCLEFTTEVDGETCWREVRMIPLSDREVIMSVRDFTKLNRARAALAEALHKEQVMRKEAERANQIKDEFLTVISHELRTPLNPILGWASLLKRGNLSEDKVAKAVETIERNAKLQTQLIDDLLDIARMLRGKVKLEAKPVSLKRTITQALETVQLAAQSKSLSIELHLAEEVLVRGDSVRLQQIVWNLLSNAVKFTPANGQIFVRLFTDGHRACIQVSDTGVGIRLEFLPYVFERFRQENSTLTRQFGGLGLGLAIVRQLCELHGGTVSVTSAGENAGTTFMVQLPLIDSATTLEGEPVERLSESLEQVHILVVDDNSDARDILTTILQEKQATVTQVASSIECLRQLDYEVPDLIICDIGLPEINGYELMKYIRQRTAEKGGQVRAIALSAYAGDKYERQAIAAGFQTYLTKPIEIVSLISTVQAVLKEPF